MGYVEGFVAAVPAGNREAYRAHVAKAVALLREFGATRAVECWGDDVAMALGVDFRKAVQAGEGEVVVFSWVEYPDKATRDAANEKFWKDPRIGPLSQPPFDVARMLSGSFEMLLDA